MSEAFTGQIALFAFPFAPVNWANCNGQLLPTAQYKALYDLIGNTYGGDAKKGNFALPNLQGLAAIGQGAAASGTSYKLGGTGGTETVALKGDQTDDAPHTHAFTCSTWTASTNSPANNLLAAIAKGAGREVNVGHIYDPGTPDTPLDPGTISSFPGAATPRPHNNMQPYLVLTYGICTNGILPTRS